MPNGTITGLKISGNRSYGVINPPQSPDYNFIEAVQDHLDREQNKRQPTSKEELWNVLQEAWRTIHDDYLIESLSNSVQAVFKNKCDIWTFKIVRTIQALYFFAYRLYFHLCLHMFQWIVIFHFLAMYKVLRVARNLWTVPHFAIITAQSVLKFSDVLNVFFCPVIWNYFVSLFFFFMGIQESLCFCFFAFTKFEMNPNW